MNSFSENMLQDHGESINPNVALGLSVALLVVSLGAFMWALKKQADRKKKSSCTIPTLLCIVAPLVCCLAGGVFLVYSTSLKERSEQDYQGLMRITNVNFIERKQRKHERNDEDRSTTYVHLYEAVFSVDWGYEWACPDHGAPVCLSSIVPCSEEICEKSTTLGTCRNAEITRAKARVERCSEKLLNGTTFDESFYSPFLATDGPSSDTDWPSIVAFGDCNRCEAKYEVASPSSLRAMRSAASTVLGIGLVLTTVLLFLKRKEPSS